MSAAEDALSADAQPVAAELQHPAGNDLPVLQPEMRFRQPVPLQPPPVNSIEALGATIVVAWILSYFLIFRKAADSRAKAAAARAAAGEPAEYFRAILGETQLDSWNGTEQGCRWTQTDDEIEVTAPMPNGAKGKDVTCRVLPTSLKVSILGTVIVEVRLTGKGACLALSLSLSGLPTFARARFSAQGKLFKRVQHEESDWSIDEGDGARILKLTLVKAMPTKGTQHWTSLVERSSSAQEAAPGPEI